MEVTFGIDLHVGQRVRVAGKLQLGLFQVVEVEVGVAEGMNEVAQFQAGDLGDHHGEQGVGGDIERHAQEHVGAALVKLAGEFAVGNVELVEQMAGRQSHVVHVSHVPGADDVAAGVRVVA